MNLRVVLRNRFTISSLFHFKDRIPKCLRSGIVYKFSCSSCEESYIGSTYVRLYSRVCEHKGVSDRNQTMLLSPKNLSIRDHSHECDTPFSIEDFTILDSEPKHSSLRLLESLYIISIGQRSMVAHPPTPYVLLDRWATPPYNGFESVSEMYLRIWVRTKVFHVSAISTSACASNIYFYVLGIIVC